MQFFLSGDFLHFGRLEHFEHLFGKFFAGFLENSIQMSAGAQIDILKQVFHRGNNVVLDGFSGFFVYFRGNPDWKIKEPQGGGIC